MASEVFQSLMDRASKRSRALTGGPGPLWEQKTLLPAEENRDTGEWRFAMPLVAEQLMQGLMAPGKAARGEYGLTADESGRVSYDGMLGDTAELAQSLTLGAGAIPGQGLGMGLRHMRGRLPESGSLNTPPTPSASDMKRLARVERVPLSQARGTQPKMGWKKFEKGDHPGALIDGYEDMPVAVRREDGEYLIFDGHHRATMALNEGAGDMPMYVIDAKDYAPSVAGKKPSEQRWTESDEELYRALLGDD